MVGNMLARPHIRFMTDALLGFAVYVGLTFALLGSCSAGSLLPLGLDKAAATGIAVGAAPLLSLQPGFNGVGANDPQAIMLILAFVFSTLFALNLSFVRHLATAYRRTNRSSAAANIPQNR